MADEGQAIRAIAPACTFSAAPCGYRFLVFKIFMTALQRVKSQCRGQGRLRQNMDLGERVFGSEDLRFRGPEVMFETSNISLSLSHSDSKCCDRFFRLIHRRPLSLLGFEHDRDPAVGIWAIPGCQRTELDSAAGSRFWM